MTDQPCLCVAVVIEAAGRVLLLKRGMACSWPGHWCFPGGRVEAGETLVACCARELFEETGLEAERFIPLGLTETLGPPHLIGLVYRAWRVRGESRNAEPDRHDAIGWFPWRDLPAPLMPPVAQFIGELAAVGADRLRWVQ